MRVFVVAVCLLAALPAWAGEAKCPENCLAARPRGPRGQVRAGPQALRQVPAQPQAHQEQRATAYNNRGNAHYFAKNYSKALADYNKALKKDPRYASAHLNKGLVYADLGRPATAIKMYDQALKLAPRFAMAYYNRGMTRLLWKKAWSPQVEAGPGAGGVPATPATWAGSTGWARIWTARASR